MTPSKKRTAIRQDLKAGILNSLLSMPGCKVFTARAEADGLQDFVSIYFEEGDRIQQHSFADAEADLIIRISTKADPRQADDRLDTIASLIEVGVKTDIFDDYVLGVFNSGFSYSDSANGNYSALELTYKIQYSD